LKLTGSNFFSKSCNGLPTTLQPTYIQVLISSVKLLLFFHSLLGCGGTRATIGARLSCGQLAMRQIEPEKRN